MHKKYRLINIKIILLYTLIMKSTVAAIIIHQEKVLLLLRDNIPTISNPNTWQLIGGHVDEGESFDNAIRREIMEETNLDPSEIIYFGTKKNENVEFRLYLSHLSDDEAKQAKLGNEGQEIRFCSIDDIKDLTLSFSSKLFYTMYFPQLVKILNGEEVKAEELGMMF